MTVETKEPKNLMDGLFEEMNRVREVIKQYEMPELKGAGMFAAYLMKQSIANAEYAIKNNDVIAMLASYQDLKEYES